MKFHFNKKNKGFTLELTGDKSLGQSKTFKLARGFTLVETLVAIAILSLSVLATFTAVQSSLQNSISAKDQITAFYLAQEGMEFIKNIRDENALQNLAGGTNTWLTGLSALAGDPCYFGKTCRIDSPAKTITDCAFDSGGVCRNLQKNSSSGIYGYISGPSTSFKRSIQFQSVALEEVRVIITISWTDKGINKSFQVTELLFNRQ